MNSLEKNITGQREEKAQHYTDVVKCGNAYVVEYMPGINPYWRNSKKEPVKNILTTNRIHLTANRVLLAAGISKDVILGLTTPGSYAMPAHLEPILVDLDNPVASHNLIEDAIKEATSILELPANWDGEGALQITKETFDAAAGFLRTYSRYLSDHFGQQIDVPEINPVKNGTIDLEWHTKSAQMLINIRYRNDEYYAYYYGDRYQNRMPIKGNVPLSEFSESLAVWMKYLV